MRRATVRDAAILARHRAEMFTDMGTLPPALNAQMRMAAEPVLADLMSRDAYLAWVAVSRDAPDEVVGGVGVQVRLLMPSPTTRGGKPAVTDGPEALVMNVFTERAWRRRGVAELLMCTVFDWAREARVSRLVLHASKDGRALYERLGFTASNEMRFAQEL